MTNYLMISLVAFWLCQLLYFLVFCMLKPCETLKDNIIEIVNEGVFTVLSGSLLYLNKEDRWRDEIVKTFMYLILANTVIVFLVVMGKFG